MAESSEPFDVAAERDRLLKSWNPPAEDHGIERVVGVPTDPADVAATGHTPMAELNKHVNPASDSVDAARLNEYGDDLSDTEDVSYEDMTNDDLRAELEKRGLPKSGNKQEMVERLEEDDESDS